MQLQTMKSYNQKDIQNLLSTPSGAFFDANGNRINAEDLQSKRELMERAIKGEIATTTDIKYTKINYAKSGDAKAEPHKRSADYQANFDHLVIEDIPQNISEDNLKVYQAVIERSFKNVQGFYMEKDSPFLFTSENREVHTRLEKNATGGYHIHVLVNRMAITDAQSITEFEQNLGTFVQKFPNHVKDLPTGKTPTDAIAKARRFMNAAGKDQALEQAADFTSQYLRDIITLTINEKLAENGLSAIAGWTGYSQNAGSNAKTTHAAKQVATEIETDNYSEESVKEVVKKIEEKTVSTLDTVVIESNLAKNKKRIAELANEMERIASENRQLTLASEAIAESDKLRYENHKLVKKTEEQENIIAEKTEKFAEEKQVLELEIGNKNNEVITLQDKLAEKENEIAEFTELLATSEEEIEQKNTVLAQLNSERDEMLSQIEEMKVIVLRKKELEKEVDDLVAKSGLLTSQNELKDATIAAKTNQIETQAQRNDELVEQNKALRKQQEEDRERIRALEVNVKEMVENARAEREQAKMLADEQQKQINQLQNTVNNTEKENSLLREFVIAIEKRLEQASKVISTLSTKLKSTANKSFLKDFVDSANNDGKEAVKAIDEDTEKKMEKLAQLRAQFNAKAQSVAKFANDIKKDDEDKNQSRPGGPKKPT